MSECVFQHLTNVTVGKSVIDVSSFAPVGHEPCVPEHTELMTDGRLGHPQRFDEIVHTHFPVAKQTQDAKAGPVCKSLQKLNGPLRDVLTRELFL